MDVFFSHAVAMAKHKKIWRHVALGKKSGATCAKKKNFFWLPGRTQKKWTVIDQKKIMVLQTICLKKTIKLPFTFKMTAYDDVCFSCKTGDLHRVGQCPYYSQGRCVCYTCLSDEAVTSVLKASTY